MKTPTDAIQITEHRVRLPTRWVVTLLALAFTLGGWLMKLQMDNAHLHERVHALEDRIEFMWGKR